MSKRISLLKGCLCGVMVSIIITAAIIMSFFEISALYIYGAAFLCGFAALLLLKADSIKAFLIAMLFSVLAFFVAEIIIIKTGIIVMFFQIRHGADAAMWAGDGFGLLVIYMCSLVGSGVGVIGAFIATIIRRI